MSLLREALRRHWAVDLLALVLVAASALMAHVADGIASDVSANQAQADARAARDRQDLCAILATIDGNVPVAISKARRDFARPKHPKDCQPVTRPSPKATVTVTPAPAATSTTSIVLIEPSPAATSQPRPAVTVTVTPRATRSPSPTPTPTCIIAPLCGHARTGGGHGR